MPQQVDYHLVRAEMNGMDYHLRVLLPFARDPAYCASIITEESDTPSKEGPVIHGAIKLYEYPIWPRTVLEQPAPLTPAQAGDLATRLQTIPPLLQAARSNLAGANARDLWIGGVRAFEEQSEALATLRTRVGGSDEGLSAAIVALGRPPTISRPGCGPKHPRRRAPRASAGSSTPGTCATSC